jgi:transcriptional regulator with XRE-family HTH domain
MGHGSRPPRSRDSWEALGQKIKESLAAKGWSQSKLAAQLGVTQSAINLLVAARRRRDSLEFYDHLATTLVISLSDLMFDLEGRVAASGHLSRRQAHLTCPHCGGTFVLHPRSPET